LDVPALVNQWIGSRSHRRGVFQNLVLTFGHNRSPRQTKKAQKNIFVYGRQRVLQPEDDFSSVYCGK